MEREAHCLKCNRKLKDTKSKDRGYGPVCWEKVKDEPDLLFFSKHSTIQDELMEGEEYVSQSS